MSGELVLHEHDTEDISGLENLLKGFQGAFDASTGTSGSPLSPPELDYSGWWLVTNQGHILIEGAATLFEAGDLLVYSLDSDEYSRVDTKFNDAQVDVTSTFTKLLSGLSVQKTVNEKLDNLVTVTTTSPGGSDDEAHGCFAGCFWINTSAGSAFQCKDASTGAAVWVNISLSGAESLPYRDFTNQSSDPLSPSSGSCRMFTDIAGQLFTKDSSGNKTMLSKGTKINDIGAPGHLGFGVGVCPPEALGAYNALHPEEELMSINGTYDINSDNYGNYKVSHDGSIMVWVPFAWQKKNADNTGDIKPEGYFSSEIAANAAGYSVPRIFINAGEVKRGVFIDKYKPSLTGVTSTDLNASGSVENKGIASSIKLGNPISSENVSKRLNPGTDNLFAGSFANCRANGKSPVDACYGSVDAIKSRGDDYHVNTLFAGEFLRFLAQLHKQAAYGTVNCAFNGISPSEPRGNNNYGVDCYDAACTFAACDDGYWGAKTAPMEARKTGGGSPFNKTTHNGQDCGISDINGNQYEFMPGVTCIAETAQAITGITRAAEAVVTITNSEAANSNYADGKPVQIGGTLTGEWATLLKNKIFTISNLSGNTFKLKNQAGAYINTSALSADYVSDLTSITGKFYVLKESVDIKSVTSGTSLSTDLWGSTGVAAMYDEIDIDFCGDFLQKFGNGSNQVYSGDTDRSSNAYKLSAAGLPLSKTSYSSSGTALMGYDYNYISIVDQLAPLGFYNWSYTTSAGVGARYWYYYRDTSYSNVSFRGGLFID